MTRPDRRSRRGASANMTACGPLRPRSLESREQPPLPLAPAPLRTSPYQTAVEQSGRHVELGLRLGPHKTPQQDDWDGHNVSNFAPERRVRSMYMIDRKPPARPASYDTKV